MVWSDGMIDFRYHVVSLVAAFLALAVGIVLGSGPLRTAFISQLTDETEELRQELADAKAETAFEQLQGEVGREFVNQASVVLLGESLKGKNVAIVRVFEPDEVDVTGIRDRLVAAGATITANVTIQPAWLDDEQTAFRAAFAAEIADTVVGVDATLAPDKVIAHALAQSLVPTEVDEGAGPDDVVDPTTAADRATVLLNLLKDADFLLGTITGPVDAVLLIAGAGPEGEDLHAAQSETIAELAGILDAYDEGTVVASGIATPLDVPTAIRSSALLNANVTTVTGAMNYFGHFTVALAVAKEIGGEAASYGYGEELALYPGFVPLPSPSPTPTPSPSPSP
jgi:hypothetical protein